MSQSGLGGGGGGERRYSVPSNPLLQDPRGMHSEDLHAWSIYRQNLNSDFTDSALGSTDKSPLPYGNFQLRDTTVQSILSHPRYGPKSALGSNMYTYLKFGLPRVFPPNHNGSQRSGTPKPKTSIGSGMKPAPRIHRPHGGMRETSSGYDSSDNETTMNYKNSRKYRSDPDFRMQNLHPSYQHPGIPLVAMQQAGVRGNEGQWSRNKSISEANLLGVDARHYPSPRSHLYAGTNRRSSVADFGPENDQHSYLISPSQIGRPMSKADSHLSIAQSRKSHGVPSTLRPGDYLDGGHGSYIYPNFFVDNLEITSPENKSMLLLSGLSFEAKSSEILAVLATSQKEATGLLDVLAGVRKKLSGDIILNGQPVASSTLSRVVAYVRNDTNLCPNMTVEKTLKFHSHLRRPNTKSSRMKMDSSDRINMLIEELGLEQVRLTNVGRLTRSEVRRLNVACQMLMETVVLILDQPTKEMDIFDTFFLVEYLRNWASTGRVVIMSLHPPTYEIFAMLTKVVLISAGRTMFSGYRRDMLPYFASIDYPCPAFKNPSDYYLDLVTLDDLSAAAILESSGRIEQLAGVFRATRMRDGATDPPPPIPLPAPIHRANPLSQAFTLIRKTIFYTQPTTLVNWISRVILAAILSQIIGAVFWDLPMSDAQLSQNDRLGYHYSVMCLCSWPLLLLLGVTDVTSRRSHVERDISTKLYSRSIYVIVEQILDLFSSSFVWLAYLIPCYSMSGLYMQGSDDFNGFYYYLGYMLLYLLCAQMLVRAVTYLIPMEKTATCVSGLLLLLTFFANGYLLNLSDMTFYTTWLEYVSPSRWTLPYLLKRELTANAVQPSSGARCRNKQVQHQDIIVQMPCPQPNGTQVLANYGYFKSENIWESSENSLIIGLAMFWAAFAIIAVIAFILDCCQYTKRKVRHFEKGHKSIPNTP